MGGQRGTRPREACCFRKSLTSEALTRPPLAKQAASSPALGVTSAGLCNAAVGFPCNRLRRPTKQAPRIQRARQLLTCTKSAQPITTDPGCMLSLWKACSPCCHLPCHLLPPSRIPARASFLQSSNRSSATARGGTVLLDSFPDDRVSSVLHCPLQATRQRQSLFLSIVNPDFLDRPARSPQHWHTRPGRLYGTICSLKLNRPLLARHGWRHRR